MNLYKHARWLVICGLCSSAWTTARSADDLDYPDPSVAAPAVQTASAVKPVMVEGDSELVKERYENGAIKIERQVALDEEKNFINHGTWTSWDPEGNMTARGEFQMGAPTGKWVRWHDNAQGKLFNDPLYQGFQAPFRSELTLSGGSLHGKWTILDAENRVASEWNFVTGLRDGESVWYFPNGAVARKVGFRDGQLDGEAVDYDEQGAVVARTIFVAGYELAKDMKLTSDGEKLHEGWVLKPHRIVSPKYDWWNGHLSSEQSPELKSVRHGKWIFWHPNGERKTEGEYDQGRRTGEWTWWYDNGQQRSVGGYADDAPHGRWAWWRRNGFRQCSGMYDHGEETGVWSTWDEQGRLIQISDYSAPVVVEPEPESEAPSEVAVRPAPIEEVPVPDLQALRTRIDGGGAVIR